MKVSTYIIILSILVGFLAISAWIVGEYGMAITFLIILLLLLGIQKIMNKKSKPSEKQTKFKIK